MEIPEFKILPAYKFLFDKARYKTCFGGRGAGRSWNYSRALLFRAMQRKTRIACFREIQNSIKDSIHRLLTDQIELLGLQSYFVITDNSILCSNGSEFIFCGLYRNVNKIKSLEGIDIADVEEAESVSEESWQILLPSIRKEEAEIWIRFNTKYNDDATYQRFVANAPSGAIVKFLNWDSNPKFPEVLKKEKDNDYAFRPHEARNIWGGEPIGYGRKVWPEFDEKIHIRTVPMQVLHEAGNCFMACDPAQHYYPACIWLALLPKNQSNKEFYKYIYAEWPTRGDLNADFHDVRKKLLYTGTLADMAKEIYVKDGTAEHGIKILRRGIDTRFAKGSGASNYFSTSTGGIVAEFAKRDNGGLQFDMPSEKVIDVQRDAIIKDLQYNKLAPVNAFNEPNLFISPNCTNMITSLKNHRLEEDSERESEKYKDFSDALRILYATISGWRYQSPKPKSEFIESNYISGGNNANAGWMG
jgi:phage terminase large subunit